MVDYREVFRKMPMPVLFVKYKLISNEQFKMKIEFINEETLSFLNKTSEELINKEFFDILPEFKDDKNFTYKIQNMDSDNIIYTKYVRSLNNFIKITIQKINDENFIFYLECCIEKRVLDNIKKKGNVFFVKDKDNKYMYSSYSYKELSGNANIDIYGLTDFDLYGAEIGSKYFEATKEFIDSKQTYTKENCNLNNNVYLLNKYSILSDDEVVGVIGVLETIEGKLERISDGGVIAEILNNSSEHIVFKDVNGIYLDCNDSFLKDLNVKREDIIGKANCNVKALSSINDSSIKTDLAVINEKKRIIYTQEINIDEQVKEFEIIKEPFLDSYGNVAGVIATGRDVSHRREIEKLQQEFFANISHELRTPLNLIFSSLQIIKFIKKESCEKEREFNKYINIIEQNSKRLLKLVNNLIDSTKMKCGYYKYNPKNGNVVSFIEDISMSVAEFAKQNNIDLIFDTNVEEKIMAFDFEKLERIMLNLLSNSIKYNKANGKIEVLLNDCGDSFNIAVRDTGIGIPSDKLEYIFERFRQVENRLRKSNEGSGIGLSLVKDLIEIQDGIIEVKSELGIGSEFKIKLPVKVLSEEHDFNKEYFDNDSNDLVKRMNIEFSDIYL
ncbi:PAS domain-containing sensor histidine kinase [Clostridium disporicum]|uniref:PAS domain-containing sensor histidine kinase n=1 Tax=Clostridium disporicum TaxID=84024 RepID=UPI0006C6ACB5|nr:HAMP domain-containing sensor histidine kinase [Clostridium disporicum]CUO85619.1 two-component histidine kinase [Clostridium disporicum]